MVSDASSASAAIRAASSSAATTELSRRRSGRTAGGGGISSSPASVGGHSPDAAELRRRTARSGEHCGEQARRTRARPIWRMRSSSAGYLSPTSSKSALVNRNSSAGSARRLPSGDPCTSARSCVCASVCADVRRRTSAQRFVPQGMTRVRASRCRVRSRLRGLPPRDGIRGCPTSRQ